MLLGFANIIRTNKDEYLSINTGALEDGTIFLLAHAVANVDHPSYNLVDYILIDENTRYESSLQLKLVRLNEIIVYTNIIDTVMVGNTQAPIFGYFPIQSKWGDQSYWNFNPPYYVKVKASWIRAISIRLCNNKGETVVCDSGTVICRLYFHRVGLMRGFL